MKVIVMAATTLCGRISPAGMGSDLDRKRLEEMRAATDASFMGAATLRQEDAEMRGPGGHFDPDRLRAVITGSGRISPSARILCQGPAPLIFTGLKEAAGLQEVLGNKALVRGLPAGPWGLSVGAAIEELASMGAQSVLIEGGGRLNYAAFAEDVVDELHLTITPYLSGDIHASTLVDGEQPLGGPFVPLKLVAAETVPTGEVFLRYQKGDNADG